MSDQRTAEIHVTPGFQVQAVYLERGRVLTVERPGTAESWRLDLPTAAPKPGESHESALARAVEEQTGGRVVIAGPWNVLDVSCRLEEESVERGPLPTGVWCTVLLAGHEDGLAAGSLKWLDLEGWEERDDLSLALRAVLEMVTM